MAVAYLILAFTLNAAANILLKLGSARGIDTASWSPLSLVAHNWQLAAGLTLFAANVIFYFLALRALPLSVAYPVMVAMSFVIINGYAFAALGEPVSPVQVAGYAAIVIGLIAVVAAAK